MAVASTISALQVMYRDIYSNDPNPYIYAALGGNRLCGNYWKGMSYVCCDYLGAWREPV